MVDLHSSNTDTGRNAIRICPPLMITRDQADFAVDTLEECLKTVA